MTDLDRPVTRRELREELEVTRRELRKELEVTRHELREELQACATKEDLKAGLRELRTHFDVVAESFKSDFNSLYDWTVANTNILTKRVRHIEVGHGSRLQSLETRVTQLKKRRK